MHLFYAAFAGALYAFSGAPRKTIFFTPFLMPLALILFLVAMGFWQQNRFNLKRRVKSFLIFSLSFSLFAYYWIPHTLEEFGGIPYPFSLIFLPLFSLIACPQLLVPFFFLAALNKIFKKDIEAKMSPGGLALLFAISEHLTPQQFPAHAGHHLLAYAPYISLAPIIGLVGLSFLVWYLSLLIGECYFKRRIERPCSLFLLTIMVLGQIFFPLPSSVRLSDSKDEISLKGRMVQANIGNQMKIYSELGTWQAVQEVYDRYAQLSLSPSKEEDSLDLIIWPETAYPETLSTTMLRQSRDHIPQVFKKISDRHNSAFLSGAHTRSPKGETLYWRDDYFLTARNSTIFFARTEIEKEGEKALGFFAAYSKMVLIPFGEGLPFGPLNQYLAPYLENVSFFAPGEKPVLFTLENGAKFFTPICYEILFSDFIRNSIQKLPHYPHFLVNLTNDSWYGDSAEPHQHLFLASWRALEFGIPLVRSTNTGITTIVFPDGRRGSSLGVGETGVLDFSLPLTSVSSPSVYYHLGPYLSLILLAVIALGADTIRLDKTLFNKIMQTYHSKKLS